MPRFDSNPTWYEELQLVINASEKATELYTVAVERVMAAMARAKVEKVLPMEARAAVIWKLAMAKEAEVVAVVMREEVQRLCEE